MYHWKIKDLPKIKTVNLRFYEKNIKNFFYIYVQHICNLATVQIASQNIHNSH